MSHITKVKTQLKDGPVLKQALRKLGYQVQEGGAVSGTHGRRLRYELEFIASKKGARIEFTRAHATDDCYEIVADWNNQRTSKKRIIGDIFQEYSCRKLMKTARRKGYAVLKNTVTRDGQIEMILRKVA